MSGLEDRITTNMYVYSEVNANKHDTIKYTNSYIFCFTLLLNKKYVVCCLKQQSHPANKTLYNTINKQLKVCIYEILHLPVNIQIAGGVYPQLFSTRLQFSYIIRILEMAKYVFIHTYTIIIIAYIKT